MSFFTVLDVSLGKNGDGFPGGDVVGGGLRKLLSTVWHRILGKSSHFPCLPLLSGSWKGQVSRAGRCAKAQVLCPRWRLDLRFPELSSSQHTLPTWPPWLLLSESQP